MSTIRCTRCGGLIAGLPEKTYDPLCSCTIPDNDIYSLGSAWVWKARAEKAETERDAFRARVEAADERIQQLSDELTLAVDKRNEMVANYTHQIVGLEDKVRAADKDAEALDEALAYALSMVDEEHGRDEDYLLGYNKAHAAHRARVGAKLEGGESITDSPDKEA